MQPKFFVRPQEQKKTYSSIHTASQHLTEYYYQPVDNWLPNLNSMRNSERQQRSERREAIAAISAVMVNHVDMATMKIVRLFNKQLVPLSIKELATKAGINVRRAERALKDLKSAGYLELQYRVEHMPDGTIKPLIAIKRLSATFFYHLGVSFEKLQHECERAKKQLAKFSKKARMKAAELKANTQDFFGRFLKKPAYRPRRAKNPGHTQNEMAMWQQLMKEHPDWSSIQIKAEAKRRLT